MIVLIIGKSGSGKDEFANLLVSSLNKGKRKPIAGKILSYTTRPVRDISDFDNHRFARYWKINPDENYLKQDKVVAYTEIAGEYYWAEKDQFTHDFNIYIVDPYGVPKVIQSNIDDHVVVEIIRSEENIDVDSYRKNRVLPDAEEDFDVHYIIQNDFDLEYLEKAAQELAEQLQNSE